LDDYSLTEFRLAIKNNRKKPARASPKG